MHLDIQDVGNTLHLDKQEVGNNIHLDIQEVGNALHLDKQKVRNNIHLEIQEVGNALHLDLVLYFMSFYLIIKMLIIMQERWEIAEHLMPLNYYFIAVFAAILYTSAHNIPIR